MRGLYIGLLCLATASSQAQEKTATLVVNCQSVSLHSAWPLDIVTFDGNPGIPQHQVGSNFVSWTSELRPRTSQPGVFEADYLVGDWSNPANYGSFTVALPTTDSDGNSLIDAIQIDKPGNVLLTGSGQSEWPNPGPFGITGSLTRAAGADSGDFSMIWSSPGLIVTNTGAIHLFSHAGDLTYTRGNPNWFTVNFAVMADDETVAFYSASTSFTVVNADLITTPQFVITNNDNSTIEVYPGSLRRSGNKYSGSFEIADGNSSSPWRDYIHWTADITDNNDADGNGIPDLTDDLRQPGLLDASFDPGSGANGDVNSLAIQTDGKVVIGGDFTSFNGIARSRIARLHPDGSLDNGFAASEINNRINSVVVRGDGQVFIGGEFTRIGSSQASRIAALDSRGNSDFSFIAGFGADGAVQGMALLKNGNVLAGG